MPGTENKETIQFQKPGIGDAAAIWQLVNDTKPLDVNSCYLYLLLCHHFPDTCVVAKDGTGEVLGFLSAYRDPRQKDTLFIWQLGVKETARGRGLARRMHDELLSRRELEDINYLELTITPSNEASQVFYRKLARSLDALLEVRDFFSEKVFGKDSHEEEQLFRIGPLKKNTE